MKLAALILYFGIFVVLPVIIVALVTRAKTNATNFSKIVSSDVKIGVYDLVFVHQNKSICCR